MTIQLGLKPFTAFVRRLRRAPPSNAAQFDLAVREVIAARVALAMTGKLSAAEARLMIAEKQLAALRAQRAFAEAVSKGHFGLAPSAYFDVYQRAVEANRKRLGKRRGSWRGRRGLGRFFFAALLCLSAPWALPPQAQAQEIDFGQIDKFESLGTGTLHVGAAPKVIIDDDHAHTVILTIWDADAETKVYWTSPDGDVSRTTIVPGQGVQTFQTVGEFKLQAVGDPHHEVKYGYVLLRLRKDKSGI